MVAKTWKYDSLYPVDAQVAADELDRIYSETGKIEPREVVNRSREATAPLHPCFEWNDEIAAEKYRENQASCLIRSIVTVEVPDEPEKKEEPIIVRAYPHVQNTYQPMRVVQQDPDKMNELLSNALRELRCFQAKYNALAELRPVFDVIEKITA